MQNNEGTLSNGMTVVALVNGMIGGIILVMPILALKVGYLMIAPVVMASGFVSYYSCLLCIRHLRNYKDLDQAVLKHFQNRRSFKIMYDLCIAFSIVVVLILYFDLICIQWSGLTTNSPLIAVINAAVLFPVVYIMKKYHFGASLLAYGIISTIGYCLFLLYMWIQAPEGPKKLQPIDRHFPQLAAALSQGFAIQMFFIPVLKQNPNRHLYKKLLAVTYLLGGLAYAFIGYGGSLSIINRQYPGKQAPQTIVQYFDQGQWQVILVQIIYLIHLYSAFPQFLLISKKRVFSVMQWPQSSSTSFKEVVYVALLIGICFVFKQSGVSAKFIIQLNGSILSFIFIVIIPVCLHIKCVYFTSAQNSHQHWQDEVQSNKKQQVEQIKQKQNKPKSPKIEMKNLEQKEQNQNNMKSEPSHPKSSGSQNEFVEQPQANDYTCCDIKYKSKKHQYCDLFLMLLMLVSGIATMVFTLRSVFENEQANQRL